MLLGHLGNPQPEVGGRGWIALLQRGGLLFEQRGELLIATALEQDLAQRIDGGQVPRLLRQVRLERLDAAAASFQQTGPARALAPQLEPTLGGLGVLQLPQQQRQRLGDAVFLLA